MGCWARPRGFRKEKNKRKTNIFRNLTNPVGGGDEVDGGRKGYGRDVYIENQENRLADRNAWRVDGWRQVGQPGAIILNPLHFVRSWSPDFFSRFLRTYQ